MNSSEIISSIGVIHPQETMYGKIKSNVLWRWFVVLSVPIFEFVWKHLLHFKSWVLYRKSGYAHLGDAVLKRRAIEVYHDDPEFKRFAQWLRSRLPDQLLEQKRKSLLGRSDEFSFSETLDRDLDEETRFGILKFALSEEVLAKVFPYFGVVPRIDTTFLMFNIPRPDLGGAEGSQRWHRDGDIYKMLSLYICLSDLDENSGMYSAVSEDSLNYHQAIPIEVIDRNKSLWKNGRHTDQYLRQYIPDSELVHLKGPIGTAALVDSASCYHKGGFCKERERLLFQINYIVDQVHKKESIIDILRLKNHPRINELVNTPVKKMMTQPNTGLLGKFSFSLARRLLTYYVQPH